MPSSTLEPLPAVAGSPLAPTRRARRSARRAPGDRARPRPRARCRRGRAGRRRADAESGSAVRAAGRSGSRPLRLCAAAPRRASLRSRRSGSAIASNAVKRGLMLSPASWNTIWMRVRSGSAAKRLAGVCDSSRGPSLMMPSVGSSSRVTTRTSVDLPQPDSPTRPTVSPLLMVKLTSSTA